MRPGHLAAFLAVASLVASAEQPSPPATPESAVALTIYNEDFAVARTTIPLDLHAGVNDVSTNEVTNQLEPDSVILRDPSAGSSTIPSFRIAEQNYDAAVVTQEWLLHKYEGKTIDFDQGGSNIVKGTIIRAPLPQPQNPYGGYEAPTQPLVEVNGEMKFVLPGIPLFPASTDGLLLKPTLRWQIESEKAQRLTAELAYITGGLNWEATYNVVTGNAERATDKAAGSSAFTEEKADVLGWVTITNRTGVDFPQARIKLMAGDVAKIQPSGYGRVMNAPMAMAQTVAVADQVTQKASLTIPRLRTRSRSPPAAPSISRARAARPISRSTKAPAS